MRLINSVIRRNFVPVNGSNVTLIFGNNRIVRCPTTRRNKTILRYKLVSSSDNTLNLSTFRGPLGTTLARIITTYLRNRAMRASSSNFFLIEIVITVNLVNANWFRRPIDGRVFANAIAFRSNLGRVFQRVNMINRWLLNILKRTMTTMTRKKIIMITTSTKIRTCTISSLTNVRPFRFNVNIRFIRRKSSRHRVNIDGRLSHLYLNRTRRRGIGILFSDALLRRNNGNENHLRRTKIIRVHTCSSTKKVRIIVRHLKFPRGLQTRRSTITTMFFPYRNNRTCKGDKLSSRGNDKITNCRLLGSHFRDTNIGGILFTIMINKNNSSRGINVNVHRITIRHNN